MARYGILTLLAATALLAALAGAAEEAHPLRSAPEYRLLPTVRQAVDGRDEEVCTTTECTLSAAVIIESMDATVDPCDDFFQFACGGWIDKNPIPEEESRWGQFSVLDNQIVHALITILEEDVVETDLLPISQAKWFYAACTDEVAVEAAGVTPLTDFLATYGGWPMTMGAWDASAFSWQAAVAAATRDLYTSALVYPWVFADEKSTDETVLYIDQPSLGMPRSVLTDPDNYAERFTAYKGYIKSTGQIISNSLGETFGEGDFDADVDAFVDFEMAVAAITTPDEDRRDVDRMYNPMTVAELQDLTPGSSIDWVSLLTFVFQGVGITIDSSTRVIVQEIDYMKNLSDLLAATDDRVVSNYIMWRFVLSLGDDTNDAMKAASFQYNMVANGITAQTSLAETCASEANDMLGFALGVPYVSRYFSAQAKNESGYLVEDLRESFEDLISVSEWLDEETKSKSIDKAEYISKFIGYPDWYDEANGLEEYYSGLTGITESSSHFDNIKAARNFISGIELDDLGEPTNRANWVMSPTIVNAYYMPEFNSITFPAGILQPPFYRVNTLQAINYGGIGQVMGHEITHGFDDQGSQYDKYGNAIPWWNNATLEAFAEKAQCIIDQYNNFRIPEIDYLLPDASVNGVTTQGENIADNGGLREAYLAYQLYVERHGTEPRLPGLEQYSPDQLFFLGNANVWCTAATDERLVNQLLTDPHSPERFRVVGPMSNMQQFSEAWNCPAGAPMNPTNKCVVW